MRAGVDRKLMYKYNKEYKNIHNECKKSIYKGGNENET